MTKQVRLKEPESPPLPRSQEILQVACELFAQFGYSAVGMRTIADAIGIQPASLYHHFGSKAEILDAIISDVSTRFVDTHAEHLPETGDLCQPLHAMLIEHIIYFYEHRRAEQVGLRDLHLLTPARAEEVRQSRRRYQDRLIEAIRRGAQEGCFVAPNPTLSALALLNMINGVNDWFNPDGILTISEVAHRYADMACQGLLRAAHL